ncbi:MAG TPA: AbrB/MazE/SpoVT family DNA-binding domain-containing protein [Candidatus Acidoferrales bacterium]|nr:AbrB/MazE/SpoVT family DNA-binding domain-containing protein [Candidatus Acidoferrales bacterium]
MRLREPASGHRHLASLIDLVVPASVRRRAGIKTGDRLEFKVSGGIINIIPKLPIADDEYTPKQRRTIDAGIGEGMKDFRKGRGHGPFTADEAVNFLKSQMKHPQTKPTKRTK